MSSTGPDTNSVGTVQAAVARPDAHGCSKGKIRRRGAGAFCSSTEVPTSSQQNEPQNGDEQRSNREAGQQTLQDTPESRQMFAPILEHNCPDGYSAMCAALNLIENIPLAPGTYIPIPWVGNKIPATIDIEEYSRFCASI